MIGCTKGILTKCFQGVLKGTMTIEQANAHQATFRANQFTYQRALYHLNIITGWEDNPLMKIPISHLNEDNDMEDAFFRTVPGRLPTLNPHNFCAMYNNIYKKKLYKTKEAKLNFLLPPAAMQELNTICGVYVDVDLRRWMARVNTDEMQTEGKIFSFVRFQRKYVYLQTYCQNMATFTQMFSEFQKPALIMIDLPWRDADMKIYGASFAYMGRTKLIEIIKMTLTATSPDGGRTFVFCYTPAQEADVFFVIKEYLKKYSTYPGYIWKYDKNDLERNFSYDLSSYYT